MKKMQPTDRQKLTPRIQVCVCALCVVQTGSGPECLQTHRPCRRTPDVNRSGCRLEPEEQKEKKLLREKIIK